MSFSTVARSGKNQAISMPYFIRTRSAVRYVSSGSRPVSSAKTRTSAGAAYIARSMITQSSTEKLEAILNRLPNRFIAQVTISDGGALRRRRAVSSISATLTGMGAQHSGELRRDLIITETVKYPPRGLTLPRRWGAVGASFFGELS